MDATSPARPFLGGPIAPRSRQGFTHRTRSRRAQSDAGGPPLAPAALNRHEHLRLGADKELLLLRRQSHGSPRRVRMTQRGEDLPTDAEIGMPHVRGFLGVGKTQRETTEIVRRHPSAFDDASSLFM